MIFVSGWLFPPFAAGSPIYVRRRIQLIGDVNSPEPGCVCRVIQSMLQMSLQDCASMNSVFFILNVVTVTFEVHEFSLKEQKYLL